MARKKTELPKTELNITSMMDLVLNLLTFFVLVSNFAAAELPGLEPPDPADSRARASEAPNKFTINVIPDPREPSKAQWVQVGVEKLDPHDTIALVDKLRREVKISANVEVDLRADKALRYQEVQPVMAAITQAGITRVNVVAQMPR
jgi:biopolymer transport protein ExbD